MADIDACKRELRRELKLRRNSLSAEERACAAEAIALRLFGLPEYQAADVVLSYLSFGSEVETRRIIERAWGDGKLVALPRCNAQSHSMTWYKVDSLDGLEESALGILEPSPARAQAIDLRDFVEPLAIVPGLAFDKQGYRLGYGGGYYDRFLANFNGVSVGLCYEALLHPSLRALGVVDTYDVPVDTVLTEARSTQRWTTNPPLRAQ